MAIKEIEQIEIRNIFDRNGNLINLLEEGDIKGLRIQTKRRENQYMIPCQPYRAYSDETSQKVLGFIKSAVLPNLDSFNHAVYNGRHFVLLIYYSKYDPSDRRQASIFFKEQ